MPSNTVGKISSGKSIADVSTFVGEKGNLFYDTSSGNIRISDGSTPGGLALNLSIGTFNAGDFKFVSNTVSMALTNENMNLVANGTGVVNIVGPLNLFGAAGLASQSYFSATAQGEVKIVDLLPSSYQAALTVTGSSDGSFVTPQNLGTMIQVSGDPGLPSRVYNDGNGNYAGFFGRRFNGSTATPTQVVNTQEIFRLGATPYTSSGWPATSTARIQFIATENQTSTAQGNQIVFATTPIGTATITPIATIDSNGIYPAADNTYYLGSASKRWKGLNLGPGTLYITDQTLGTQVGLAVNNGVLLVNGANQLQVGQLKFIDNTIESTTGSIDIQIGVTSSSANLVLNRNVVLAAGKTFGLVDTVLGTPATMSVTNGVLLINGANQLQVGQLKFINNTIQSTSTSTNIVIGQLGDTGNLTINRNVSIGTSLTFADTTVQSTAYLGTATTSKIGGVKPDGTTISINAGTISVGTIANSNLTNSNVTVTAGTGMSGGGSVALGGSITLTNSGVTSIVAGSNISISGSTGAVTISSTVTGAVIYKGAWNASTNTTPTINTSGQVNSVTPTSGWEYSISATGTQNIGSGSQTYTVGGFIIWDTTAWQYIPPANAVSSFNTRTGAVTLTSGDITSALSNNSIANSLLVNSSVTVGSTAIALGASSTTLAGLSSVTSTSFVGALTGNASSATTVTNGVYTTDTGTVTNTMLAGSIANAKLTNSSVTIGSTAVALGATVTTFAGLTSVTSTSFVGALSGNASTVTNGVYTTDTGSVTNTMLAGSIANAKLLNSSVTVTAGTGMSGGGAVSLGGTITLTNAGVTSATAGTGIGVSGSTGAVTFTNTGVTSAVAGTGITVSASNGAVTFGVATATTSSLGAVQPDGTTITISGGVISSVTATPTTVTTPSAITVAMNGPGMYIYTPSTNANVNITLGSFQAGRIVRMFITPQAGAQTFTFTGINTAQNSLQKTAVKCIGPGIVGNIIAEIFCTTAAIGGIYINFINAQ